MGLRPAGADNARKHILSVVGTRQTSWVYFFLCQTCPVSNFSDSVTWLLVCARETPPFRNGHFLGTPVAFVVVAHTFPSIAARESAAMAARGPRGVGSSRVTRKPVLFQNDSKFQLLVDADLELIGNEGAGICLAASGQQALVAHCARQGKKVPPALPQNARQMRTQIIDFVVHHRALYSLDSVWQVGDRLLGKEFDDFIAHYHQTHVFMSTSMLPVFAELMRMWTSDPSLGIESPAPRVLHYVPARPVSHFQEVLPMNVSETITQIQARVSNGRFKTTVFSDFECYGGVLVWQNLVESDIIFVNVYLNLHWQLALRLHMVMMLDSEVIVHRTLGLSAVSQRPENLAARLGDGSGGTSTLA